MTVHARFRVAVHPRCPWLRMHGLAGWGQVDTKTTSGYIQPELDPCYGCVQPRLVQTCA